MHRVFDFFSFFISLLLHVEYCIYVQVLFQYCCNISLYWWLKFNSQEMSWWKRKHFSNVLLKLWAEAPGDNKSAVVKLRTLPVTGNHYRAQHSSFLLGRVRSSTFKLTQFEARKNLPRNLPAVMSLRMVWMLCSWLTDCLLVSRRRPRISERFL